MSKNYLDKEKISEKLADKLIKEFISNPPTIGVIGMSGTGKSSTLNALFGLNLLTSPSVRGTTEASSHKVMTQIRSGPAQGEKVALHVVDAPGLGEDIRVEEKYIGMYRENLPKCDIIMWVLSARNRAVSLDQEYLRYFLEHKEKMVFCINQVDLVDPLDWNLKKNLPSADQKKNIEDIENDRKEKMEFITAEPIKIVSYSAYKRYRVMQLFNIIADAVDDKKRIYFDLLRATTVNDWLDRAEGLSWLDKIRLRGSFF